MDGLKDNRELSDETKFLKYGINDYHYLTHENEDDRKSLTVVVQRNICLIIALIAITLLFIAIFVILVTIKTPTSDLSLHRYYNHSCVIVQQSQDKTWKKIDICKILSVLVILLVIFLLIISLIIWTSFKKSRRASHDSDNGNARYQLLVPNIMKERLPPNPFRRINQCYSQSETELEHS
ncbi:hypothetical protein TrispH2_004517 [Trichoplax sp. H2]|nr:hypothetical protein TrispH2_004517 [Trichoplax sp. H2]|eukprot:RDD43291.1 hypothetical protein TrispH2_004517 [Trichoplax sp. H2]